MQHKHYVVLGVLVLSLTLSGCMGTMRGANQRVRQNPLGTATPGTEPAPAGADSPAAGGAAPAPDAGTTAAPGATLGTGGAQPPGDTQPLPATPTPAPAVTPTVNPAFANVQLPTAADLEERWRAMQVDRAPFGQTRNYFSPGYQVVWWFDPVFGQILPIGQLQGEFAAQATFRIRGQWIQALEIPYLINQQYGITVPPPILKRMQDAGKTEWVDVFVYLTQDMEPR